MALLDFNKDILEAAYDYNDRKEVQQLKIAEELGEVKKRFADSLSQKSYGAGYVTALLHRARALKAQRSAVEAQTTALVYVGKKADAVTLRHRRKLKFGFMAGSG